MNMAIDETIAVAFSEGKVPPTLRLYQWASPTLTLGSFQKMESDLSGFLEENPIPFVRRITGGRALLHDREITYSVVGGTHDPLFLGGIKETFYSIAQGLLAGLNRLGVDAQIYTPNQDTPFLRSQSPFCADSLSWYELAISGKKLIGSAQKRWVNSFLQHGSLPLTPSPFAERLHPKRSLVLCDLLPKIPLPHEIKEAIRIGFETALQIQLKEETLTFEEEERVHGLVAEKYGNRAWNENRKKGAETLKF